MSKTENQFDKVIETCQNIFSKKSNDYGTAWRVLRPSSLTDQIYIKAQRIRNLETIKESKVEEGVEPEYIGIINYCIMALIQLELGISDVENMSSKEAISEYTVFMKKTRDLMIAKNHDYGEAWRNMRVSSFTDLILMKLLRVKQIEENDGETLISEGIDANYMDMINYAVFALIKLSEYKNEDVLVK
jgi:hypothetical protein